MSGFQNTTTGSINAINRKIKTKVFPKNIIDGGSIIKPRITPFRYFLNLGDIYNRKNQSCGSTNQINDVRAPRKGDTPTINGKDCNIPLASGNSRYVSDSSLYSRIRGVRGT
jgi:hypothetical protein|tara:strand:- start:368 stop:703 length:336 start_codon:yes stop_codon:yes gene_type:complete